MATPDSNNNRQPEAKPANLDFTLEDMNGNEVAFKSLKGKVVLAAPGSLPNDGLVIEDQRSYD